MTIKDILVSYEKAYAVHDEELLMKVAIQSYLELLEKAESGDRIVLYNADGKEAARFDIPGTEKKEEEC